MELCFSDLSSISQDYFLPDDTLDRDFMLVSTGTSEYTLTKEDVGRRLAFVYIPINFEGFTIYLLLWNYHLFNL